jgi:hypothetical protein
MYAEYKFANNADELFFFEYIVSPFFVNFSSTTFFIGKTRRKNTKLFHFVLFKLCRLYICQQLKRVVPFYYLVKFNFFFHRLHSFFSLLEGKEARRQPYLSEIFKFFLCMGNVNLSSIEQSGCLVFVEKFIVFF